MKISFVASVAIIAWCPFVFAIDRDTLPGGDTTVVVDSSDQQDINDVLRNIFHKKDFIPRHQSENKINFSIVPAVGYTLSTGFIIGLSSIASFFTTKNRRESESVINLQAFYDSHNQQSFMIQSNISARTDEFRFVSDFRAKKYPDITYGLRTGTSPSNADNIIYSYIRLYQIALKKINPSLYAGGGYCLDYHNNIAEGEANNGVISAFDKYGKTTNSYSSGFNLNILLDSRNNHMNPSKGIYANIFYRNNWTFLGSDSKWSSIQLDIRKYFRLSDHSNNVLAVWSYTWLSLTGKQPYLDLPSVGNDTYNNTGRGYTINRFRGKNMLYVETEYRFGLTKNGLLGAVIFANLQSYPPNVTLYIKKFIPAIGSGIRIKMNKHANINAALDYGIGIDGSHGFFVNLGEIF